MYTTRILSLFFLPIVFSIIGCIQEDNHYKYIDQFNIQPDSIIYLTSLPSNVYLLLGKSIYIQNGKSIFKFIGIVEHSPINSRVIIKVYYNHGSSRIIELNTNDIPQTYILENGYRYLIHLKEIYSAGDSYGIMFRYNKYADL